MHREGYERWRRGGTTKKLLREREEGRMESSEELATSLRPWAVWGVTSVCMAKGNGVTGRGRQGLGAAGEH